MSYEEHTFEHAPATPTGADIPGLDEALKLVDPEWHKEFIRYVTTGDASDDFLRYRGEDPSCDRAVALVLQRMMDEALGESTPPAPQGERDYGIKEVRVDASSVLQQREMTAG
jgi:hypothetical protein